MVASPKLSAPRRVRHPARQGCAVGGGLRQLTISEFTAWLGAQTNKQDRPFQKHTIRNYADAARTLGKWMGAGCSGQPLGRVS